jgi:hypothetical protein
MHCEYQPKPNSPFPMQNDTANINIAKICCLNIGGCEAFICMFEPAGTDIDIQNQTNVMAERVQRRIAT